MSTAEHYLHAVLELQPDNLEAQWQILNLKAGPLKNVPLYDRVDPLAALSPEFGRLASLAQKTRQEGLLHLMNAIHAGHYNDFDRALTEIDRAVAADRESVRFLTTKGRLLVWAGKWSCKDALVEQGIEVLSQARVLAQAHPSIFVRDESFDFYLAEAASSLTHPRWEETAAHYERFLEKARESTLTAFAWNNVSIAYRRLGACDRARAAADKALAIMKFGAAEENRQYADFCVEMQKGGVVASQDASGRPLPSAPGPSPSAASPSGK